MEVLTLPALVAVPSPVDDDAVVAPEDEPDADVPLVVAANRDERHARPTEVLRWRMAQNVLRKRSKN